MSLPGEPHIERAPDVSALMTVYNTAPFLAEAIDSVLAQRSRRTSEVILVDDGSTDDSLRIAERFALRHPKSIRVFRHPGGKNRGISASRNLGLTHARAPLLAFLDSDDVWLPHHLDTLADLLDAEPEVAMVYAGAERWVDFDATFDEAAARRADWGSNYLPPLVPAGARPGVLARGQLLAWFQADESMVPCICSVMVRTAPARAAGGFCNSFRGLYDDQAFHTRMSLQYPIYALDECVARYRQHARSCCALARVDDNARNTEQQRFSRFLQHEQVARTETVPAADL